MGSYRIYPPRTGFLHLGERPQGSCTVTCASTPFPVKAEQYPTVWTRRNLFTGHLSLDTSAVSTFTNLSTCCDSAQALPSPKTQTAHSCWMCPGLESGDLHGGGSPSTPAFPGALSRRESKGCLLPTPVPVGGLALCSWNQKSLVEDDWRHQTHRVASSPKREVSLKSRSGNSPGWTLLEDGAGPLAPRWAPAQPSDLKGLRVVELELWELLGL